MRVLHLTTEYPPIIYGGLGTAIGGLVEASARSGLEVGVLLIGETGLAAYGQQAQSNESTVLEAFALPHGVRIFPTPWGAAADYALRLVRRWRPDVIHLHVFWLWGIAKQLQEMTGIPLVYTVHSLDVAEYQLGGGPTQCLDQWPIQQAVLEGADLIIAPSRSEGDLVGQYSPAAIGKVRVVGHGIDERQERWALARSPSAVPTVLFVGRFVDRKKLHYIDFTGRWFNVKGPAITPRPPQGQPPVVALAHSAVPYRFAAEHADLALVTPQDADDARRIVDEVKASCPDRGADTFLYTRFVTSVLRTGLPRADRVPPCSAVRRRSSFIYSLRTAGRVR